MEKILGILMMLCLLFLGCASEKRKISLDNTLRLYEKSIRWGAYQDAQTVLRGVKKPLGPEDLSQVKVISYEVIRQEILEDQSEMDQTVEIRFYHEQQGTLQRIIDNQRWVYDEENEIWQLHGDLPNFRSAIQ